MKIITKNNRKDFYDFQVGYDTDDSLVYNRETRYCYERTDKELIDELYKRTKDYFPKNYESFPDNKKYWMNLEYIIVGIYPFLYVMPFGFIYKNEGYRNIYDPLSIKEYKMFYISEDLYNDRDKLLGYIEDKFSIKKKQLNFSYDPKIEYNYNNTRNHIKSLVIEDQDIFKIAGGPIFILFSNDHNLGIINYRINLKSSVKDYIEKKYGNGSLNLIVNPIFNDLDLNLISFIEDKIYSRVIYSDIENYLYSVKQEPTSEPDNNTKILNAGFDLKTSFRKVK